MNAITSQRSEIVPQCSGRMRHNRLIGSGIRRIVRFIISVCDGNDHCQMAKLPCVHILHLLVRNLCPLEQRFQPLRIRLLFGRKDAEGRWLNEPRRQRRMEYAVLKSAARAGKCRQNSSVTAKLLPYVIVLNGVDHSHDTGTLVLPQLRQCFMQLIFPHGQEDEIVDVTQVQRVQHTDICCANRSILFIPQATPPQSFQPRPSGINRGVHTCFRKQRCVQ